MPFGDGSDDDDDVLCIIILTMVMLKSHKNELVSIRF